MVWLSRILKALHPGFLALGFLLFIHGHPWMKPDKQFPSLSLRESASRLILISLLAPSLASELHLLLSSHIVNLRPPQ
jgi:hypothetical protein